LKIFSIFAQPLKVQGYENLKRHFQDFSDSLQLNIELTNFYKLVNFAHTSRQGSGF